MFHLIKELPEPVMGVSIAALGWFGFCYGVLSPRVMEADKEISVFPACIEELNAAQDQILARLTKDGGEERARTIEPIKNRIASKEAQIFEIEEKRKYLKTTRDTICQDLGPFCNYFPDYSQSLPSAAEVKKMRAELNKLKSNLDNLPPISLPKAPDSELLATCTCASAQAIAGKRSDYTISLTSFRLIQPASITKAKSDMSAILKIDGCGKPSWEKLS